MSVAAWNCMKDGFDQYRVLFMAGAIAAIGSITYPAISVYVSARAKPDQQGNCLIHKYYFKH